MSLYPLQIGSNATPKKWTGLRIWAAYSASFLFAVHSFRIFRIFSSDTSNDIYKPGMNVIRHSEDPVPEYVIAADANHAQMFYIKSNFCKKRL